MRGAVAIAIVVSLVGCRGGPKAQTVPFEDNFNRASLGANWFSGGGDWRIRDGYVYTTFANNNQLFLNVDLPNDVVAEVEVYSEDPIVDGKVEFMTDGRTHQSGYVFIAGGWKNTISCIARLDEHGKDRIEKRPTGLVGKRWYRWRIEKDGGTLRWLIDGKPYMTFEDKAPLQGPGHNRLGFGNWQNQLRFDNLKVWALSAAPPVNTSTTGR